MWNLKCTIILVIIGATGIVTRSLRKNVEAVSGKNLIYSLQKTAILGTSHNTVSIAVWSLKPEQWGSPLVQEKYQEENACDKRHSYTTTTTTTTTTTNNNNNNNNNKSIQDGVL